MADSTLAPKRNWPPSNLTPIRKHKPELLHDGNSTTRRHREPVSAVKTPVLDESGAELPTMAEIPPQTPKRRKQKPEILLAGSSSGPRAVKIPVLDDSSTSRERVLGILKMFRERCEEMMRPNVNITRVDLKVYNELKRNKEVNETKEYARMIGSVPWVEVGDRFEYRAELVIVGLHRPLRSGIDCVEYDIQGRWKVAICVVASEGNGDKMDDPNVLWYRGEGGDNQVMEGGNLALKNSYDKKNEVRVVRGLKVESKGRKVVYFYDGLYEVVGWNTTKGDKGNKVFVFEMRRKPGQPKIDWKNLKKHSKN